MTISDIERLSEIQSVSTDDLIHILRKEEEDEDGKGTLLSYKATTNSLRSLYETKSTLNALSSRVDSIVSEFVNVCNSIPTKQTIDATFTSKETFEGVLPSLLSYSRMEALTATYATENKMNNYEAQAKKEAHKLADEITDFIGAAVIGINQSSGAAMSATTASGSFSSTSKDGEGTSAAEDAQNW